LLRIGFYRLRSTRCRLFQAEISLPFEPLILQKQERRHSRAPGLFVGAGFSRDSTCKSRVRAGQGPFSYPGSHNSSPAVAVLPALPPPFSIIARRPTPARRSPESCERLCENFVFVIARSR
jgi:hypothetical protein